MGAGVDLEFAATARALEHRRWAVFFQDLEDCFNSNHGSSLLDAGG
jgi:hypothetical protein